MNFVVRIEEKTLEFKSEKVLLAETGPQSKKFKLNTRKSNFCISRDEISAFFLLFGKQLTAVFCIFAFKFSPLCNETSFGEFQPFMSLCYFNVVQIFLSIAMRFIFLINQPLVCISILTNRGLTGCCFYFIYA